MTFRYHAHAHQFSDALGELLTEQAKEASSRSSTSPVVSTEGLSKALSKATPLQQVRTIISLKQTKTASEELMEYRAREAVQELVDNNHRRLDEFLAATQSEK